MKMNTAKLTLCRCWLARLLHRREAVKTTCERAKAKRQRHHGPTTFFELP